MIPPPRTMDLTDFHARYLAHELSRHCASDDVEKLAPADDRNFVPFDVVVRGQDA